ncbi:MAG: YbhB/YbcL family Raf kinase inhibitor-like protein [Bradymonadia bacterium]
MRRFFAFIALAFLGGCAAPTQSTHASDDLDPVTGQAFTLEVSSNTLAEDLVMPEATVFNGFGCTGGNVSPEISWSEGPEGTQSYLVMLYDPDAPTGVGFHHWWVANVPPSTLSLPEGFGTDAEASTALGTVQGRMDYGGEGYGGPCPPMGRTHRYQFYVWALDVASLPLEAGTSPVVARFMVGQHALAVGRLVATYGR